MSNLKLPDPESAADEVLKKSSQAAPPVSIESVLGLWPGLTVSTESLENPGYLVDLGFRGGEIVVRAEDAPLRRRYTVAHELGHWYLSRSVVGTSLSDKPIRQIEQWCDLFAASLLMPRPWVLHELRNANRSRLLDCVMGAPAKYEVSHSAFRVRLTYLTRVSIAEVVQAGEGVEVASMYISKRVERERVQGIMSSIAAEIRQSKTHAFSDSAGGFVTLHRLLEKWNDRRRWLIAIFPERSPDQRSKSV